MSVLMQELQRIEQLTPITPDDYPLYQTWFARHFHWATYAHSWTYILQACRGFGLGLKIVRSHLLLSLGLHREHLVVVRPLGLNADTLPEFCEILAELAKVSGKSVYLKKLFADEADLLLARGGFVSSSEYPWDEKAHADEDTFPEMILDLNVTLDSNHLDIWKPLFSRVRKGSLSTKDLNSYGDHFRKFRQGVSHFQRTHVITKFRFNADLSGETENFLRDYFESRNGDVSAYENMLKMPTDYVEIARHSSTQEVVGLTVLDHLSLDTMGYYAGVYSRAYTGLSEYMYFSTFQRLYAEGVHYVTLGGNEKVELYKYKLKFAPIEERQMQMLVYR